LTIVVRPEFIISSRKFSEKDKNKIELFTATLHSI
jgi:hypothetical protein